MSYGVKYLCEWQSPMRDRHRYHIRILERGYVGDAATMYPTGDVLTVTYGQMDDNELVSLKSSEAKLSLLCTESGDPYISLFTTDPLRYKLSVRRYVVEDATGKTRLRTEWEGFLQAGTYVQDFANPPYRVSLRATDGLALLEDMSYLDESGNKYQGVFTIEEIISGILSRIDNGFEIVYNVHDNIITPEQDTPSVRHIAISAKDIYTVLGEDKTPSCYDVLTAILETLQLQLFQSNGAWHIRSVASLAVSDNVALPIYSDNKDAKGMSVAASLSLCPPYRNLKVKRPELINEQYESASQGDMLNKGMWSPSFGKTQLYARDFKDRIRLKASIAKRAYTRDIGGAFISSQTFYSSKTMTLTVGFDCYNLTTSEKDIEVGLVAYPASEDIYSKFMQPSKNRLIVDMPIWYWSVTKNKWVKVEYDKYTWADEANKPYPLSNMWVKQSLAPAKKAIPFEVPVSETQLVKESVSLSVSTLDIATTKSLRFALFVVGSRDIENKSYLLSPIELRNPSIEFKSTADIVGNISFDEARVSEGGLKDLNYTQTLADSWVVYTPELKYKAQLLNTLTDTALYGLITPLQRPLLADAAIANIRLLRGRILRQVEGEIYVNEHITLNSTWIDREARRYYTNYIAKNYKRGLCNVQLREIGQHRDMFNIDFAGLTSVVGLDTSVYAIRDYEDVVRIDLLSGKAQLVEEIKYDRGSITIKKGQRCVCVISDTEWKDGGKGYSLTAYDTDGNVLSYIEDVTDFFDDNIKDSPMVASTLARSAKYDANVGIWTLIADISLAGGTPLSSYEALIIMLTKDAELIAKTTYTEATRSNPKDFILIPNGFIYKVWTNSKAYLWRHSNAEHVDAVVESIDGFSSIAAVNEHFIVGVTGGSWQVLKRIDTSWGYDINALVEFDSNTHEFVALNNALVVFRERDKDLVVYDARTGRTLTIEVPSGAHYWLSGDAVYFATPGPAGEETVISAQRIVPGDGVGYVPYITVDGETYIDINGLRYLTKK